ncbi:MAG: transcriptional repressor NrdR [Spirochaetales bacterium]|jgi:transcriptional repressor NrdR|nr:transcriptional repressor NrdR [Spirochaetales bacterium]
MRCPHCNGIEDKVIESRQNASGTVIRRRRECAGCGYRFTSYEHIEEKKLKVIKRDGRREPFDLQKLEVGIQKSLEKRPVSEEVIEAMLHQIEDEAMLKTRSSHELAASDLGDMVLQKLYTIDRVGYVRFASVYRMFDNVEEFIKAIEDLSQQSGDDSEKK